MDVATVMCDAVRMRDDDERGWLGEVDAPDPPVALTTLEIVNLQVLAREQIRRATNRLERKRAAAGPARPLPGRDADVVRQAVFSAIDAKLEAWLQECWPLVDAAKAVPRVVETSGEGETVGEARWNAGRAMEQRVNGRFDADRVEFVVVSEGVRGMLGVGQEPARVIARLSLGERVA